MIDENNSTLEPPTDGQCQMARDILEQLTNDQRRAIYAVVAFETLQEQAAENAAGHK